MNQRPVEGVNGDSPKADILNILRKYGISETEVTLWGTGTPCASFSGAKKWPTPVYS